MKTKIFALITVSVILSGCISSPPVVTKPITEPNFTPSTPPIGQSFANEEIREIIGLGLPEDGLGFSQKSFNPCDHNIRPLKQGTCSPEYLSLVGLQIRCRDTRGTVKFVGQKISLPNPNIRWQIGTIIGQESLDEDGFGIIYARSSWSLKKQKIKITNRGRFLYMSLSDLRSVIVPVDWCL